MVSGANIKYPLYVYVYVLMAKNNNRDQTTQAYTVCIKCFVVFPFFFFIKGVWWINMRDVLAFNKNGRGPKYDTFPFLKCSDIKYSSAFRGL